MDIDYLIVGQGLAGTLLSYFLIEKGAQVLVIDDDNPNASSKIASGLINPITGRRFVKSWLFEQLWPKAIDTYRTFEDLLSEKFFFDKKILRSLPSIKMENDWQDKMTRSEYNPYMVANPNMDGFMGHIHESPAYGEVLGARIELARLLKRYRQWLLDQNCFFTEKFDVTKMNLHPDLIKYKSITAKTIVFCEGWKVIQNPFFEYLRFEPVKGEILRVRIPGLKVDKILKQQVFLIPMGEQEFWVGTTNEWDLLDEKPTNEKRAYLVNKLTQLLNTPFEILEHKAAVRPSTAVRRPVLGRHPEHSNLCIFNGLGTKGVSLGPYWADIMSHYLAGNCTLPEEVSI